MSNAVQGVQQGFLIGRWSRGPGNVVQLFQQEGGLAFSTGAQTSAFTTAPYAPSYAANLCALFRRTIGVNLSKEPPQASSFLPQLSTTAVGMPGVSVALFGRKEGNGDLKGLRWGIHREVNGEESSLEVTDPVAQDCIRRAPNGVESIAYAKKFRVIVEMEADSRIKAVSLQYQRSWYATNGKTSAHALVDFLSSNGDVALLETLVQLGLAPDQITANYTPAEESCFQEMMALIETRLPLQEAQRILRKFLRLYPTLFAPLSSHVLSRGGSLSQFEFILGILENNLIANDPHIAAILRLPLDPKTDPCSGLLEVLGERCTDSAGAGAAPQPVSKCSDLTVVELVKSIELYVKIEKKCGPFTSENAKLLWQSVEALALRRDFFPAGKNPNPCSKEEIEIHDALRLLCLYPDLKRRFAIFHSKVCGMLELKLSLLFDVFHPLSVSGASSRYKIDPVNGILLYGPPGCGKTFFANLIAKAMGGTVSAYSAGSHGSSYVNGTARNIRSMFDKEAEAARSGNPSTILIDECSSVFPKRSGLSAHQSHVEQDISEFLQQMEGCGSKRILIVGATNYPDKMDTAVVRTGRFDRHFYLSPPDRKTRKELFQWYSKDRPMQRDIDYDALAAATNWFVSSDIQAVMNTAARTALKREERITGEMILEAIRHTRPSLTPQILAEYAQIQRRMQGGG